MRLDLDTEIRYLSGERAGALRKVLFNEQNGAEAVVMATDDLVSRSVVVDVAQLQESPGGGLEILLTPEEVEALRDYEEALVSAAPDEWAMSQDAAPGGELFPATIYQPIVPVVEVNNLSESMISIDQGTEVGCLDGRYGIVDEVRVDASGTVTAFVARPDSIDDHDRLIPRGLVQQVTPNQVLLNCTLEELPIYSQELVDEQEEPEY